MKEYPTRAEARKQILDIGRRMYDKGFVAANDGNITCRVSDHTVIATPTGISKGFMTSDMLMEVDMDGNVVGESDYRPSSEVLMHLRVYKENPDVMAVTHAHPPVATSFAVAGIALDLPILTEAIGALGNVPVAKYGAPGTQEVPDSIAPFCTKYNAVLLANHGALSWGKDLFEAYYRLETTEYYADITMNVRDVIGKYHLLSYDQVALLVAQREGNGMTTGGTPYCTLNKTNNKDVLPGTNPPDGVVAYDKHLKKEKKLEQLLDDAVKRVLG